MEYLNEYIDYNNILYWIRCNIVLAKAATSQGIYCILFYLWISSKEIIAIKMGAYYDKGECLSVR